MIVLGHFKCYILHEIITDVFISKRHFTVVAGPGDANFNRFILLGSLLHNNASHFKVIMGFFI